MNPYTISYAIWALCGVIAMIWIRRKEGPLEIRVLCAIVFSGPFGLINAFVEYPLGIWKWKI